MTLLVISPDYASHLLPLATLSTAWSAAGERVVIATGPSTASIVDAVGAERMPLQLGRGSNPGVIKAEDQVDEEADSLRGFFAATREGMIPTLQYQAKERLTDLMWEPEAAGRATLDIIDRVQPDAIIVDHLAFSARIALIAAGIPHGDVVLGHPSALPVGDEVYGYPPTWPAAFTPDPDDLLALRRTCDDVTARFTAQWNRVAAIFGAREPVRDAFAEHGATVLYNYPRLLADERREPQLPPHDYLGSAVRAEADDPEVDAWLADDRPFVYASFGSFLSVRGDVMERVVAALRRLGMRAAIANGSTTRDALGDIPSDWLVREYLPQVRLLGSAAAAVTHGGNNSVTEAVACGVPMVVLPFSTDQFAGAAAIERRGTGVALDPNSASVDDLADALATVAHPDFSGRRMLREAAEHARQDTGPSVARRALTASATSWPIAVGSPAAAR